MNQIVWDSVDDGCGCAGVKAEILRYGADAFAPFEAQGRLQRTQKKNRRLTSLRMTVWVVGTRIRDSPRAETVGRLRLVGAFEAAATTAVAVAAGF